MAVKWLAGAPVAATVLAEVKRRAQALKARGITPGLGTILVGDDGPSAGYVRKKHETCAEVGIASYNLAIPAESDQDRLMAAVSQFNQDPKVHAYIIQYPVPAGFDFNGAMLAMNPDKDADGLHPANLGRLVLQEPGPVPCTPAGIQAMLLHYGIEIGGKEVVVIGRGPTLGRPLSLLLTLKQPGANAAVTVVHTGVADIGAYSRRADVVVAAVGVANFVKPDMVKPGAVVIGGGITWKGKRLISDVDDAVADVAAWMTPRLGGVGPTTVALLLRNTVQAAERVDT